MKLVRCHIENFGKIRNYTVEFSSGVNVFCEENGWGKSTLAEFILDMFYGFGAEGKHGAFENDRKRYKPWQGGTYGGEITYEKDGSLYTLSRVFGVKASEDVTELRKEPENLPVRLENASLGDELFGINRESFCRTVFIGQDDCETGATDGVNAKLGNLADNTDDINSYEKVIGKLGDALNRFSDRKRTGELAKIKASLTEMDKALKQTDSVQKSFSSVSGQIDKKRKDIELLKSEQEELKKKRSEFSAYADLKAKMDKYDELKRECAAREEELKKTDGLFPAELPSEDDLDAAIEDCRRLSIYEKELKDSSMPPEKEAAFSEMSVLFTDGVPDGSVYDGILEKIAKLKSYRFELKDRELSEEERLSRRILSEKFEKRIPEEKDFDEIREKLRENDDRKTAVAAKKSEYETLKNIRISVPENSGTVIMIVLSVLCAAVGAYFVTVNLIAGIALLAVGAGLFFSALAIRKSRKRKAEEEIKEHEARLDSLAEEIEADSRKYDNTENELKDFFSMYKMVYSPYGINDGLYRLKSESEQYKRLLLKENDESVAERKEAIQNLTDEINTFFVRYNEPVSSEPENCEKNVYEIKRKAELFKELSEREAKRRKSSAEYGSCREKIEEFFGRIGIRQEEDAVRQLINLKSRLQSRAVQNKEWLDAKKRLEGFAEENNAENFESINIPEHFSQQDIDGRLGEIDASIDELKSSIQELNKQADGYAERLDVLSETEKEYLRLKQDYEEKKKKLKIIEKTKEFLEEAKTSFTARYMEPVMKGFRKYYRILTGISPDSYMIDANTNLTVKEEGMQRELKFLSKGRRDLTGVCMRMALVDAMYEDEKPFVVFDDPFVNLDDEKTEKGRDFLEDIAKEYQVIYFTCHSGRKR